MKVDVSGIKKQKKVNKKMNAQTSSRTPSAHDEFIAFVKEDYTSEIVEAVENEMNGREASEVEGQEILTKVLANHQGHRFQLNEPFSSKPLSMSFDPSRMKRPRSR